MAIKRTYLDVVTMVINSQNSHFLINNEAIYQVAILNIFINFLSSCSLTYTNLYDKYE
jgi:hypothetical protein